MRQAKLLPHLSDGTRGSTAAKVTAALKDAFPGTTRLAAVLWPHHSADAAQGAFNAVLSFYYLEELLDGVLLLRQQDVLSTRTSNPLAVGSASAYAGAACRLASLFQESETSDGQMMLPGDRATAPNSALAIARGDGAASFKLMDIAALSTTAYTSVMSAETTFLGATRTVLLVVNDSAWVRQLDGLLDRAESFLEAGGVEVRQCSRYGLNGSVISHVIDEARKTARAYKNMSAQRCSAGVQPRTGAEGRGSYRPPLGCHHALQDTDTLVAVPVPKEAVNSVILFPG